MKNSLVLPLLITALAGQMLAVESSTIVAADSPPAHAKPQLAPLPPGPDRTAEVVTLGNPFAERFEASEQRYARNVWVIESFGGKLYFGHGNSSNKGPASNAGQINSEGRPGIDIWTWDPATAGLPWKPASRRNRSIGSA